jgi:glycosyltransferase involved in cell wall biosynthesis
VTALLPEATGVDVYILRLVEHLGRVDRDNEYRILANLEDRDRLRALVPENFDVVPVGWRPRATRLFAQQVALPLYAAVHRIDVVHSPSFIMPMARGHARHVLTVYDMTSFTHPDLHIALRRSKPYAWAVRTSIRRADVVTVPSAHTRASLLGVVQDVASSKVLLVPPGISAEFSADPAPDDEGVRRRLGLPASYILFVGTIEPRKNLSRLVEAYGHLIRSSAPVDDLVIVGRRGWQYGDVLEQIAGPELRGRVHLTGYVTREELPAIYRGASLFVYPSIGEGFGFPPLEAMACGIPTISSRGSALEEQLTGAAWLIAPEDVEELADALQTLLADRATRARLRARGLERASAFRWEHTAEATRRVYESLAARANAPVTTPAGPPRLSR